MDYFLTFVLIEIRHCFFVFLLRVLNFPAVMVLKTKVNARSIPKYVILLSLATSCAQYSDRLQKVLHYTAPLRQSEEPGTLVFQQRQFLEIEDKHSMGWLTFSHSWLTFITIFRPFVSRKMNKKVNVIENLITIFLARMKGVQIFGRNHHLTNLMKSCPQDR